MESEDAALETLSGHFLEKKSASTAFSQELEVGVEMEGRSQPG